MHDDENPLIENPADFEIEQKFFKNINEEEKEEYFKQCRLCCFVFLSSANIFVVPFLGKCLDIVSSQIDVYKRQLPKSALRKCSKSLRNLYSAKEVLLIFNTSFQIQFLPLN